MKTAEMENVTLTLGQGRISKKLMRKLKVDDHSDCWLYNYFCTFVTCIDTLLKDPPMTPAIASGLSSCKAYDPSGQMNSVSSTLVREALTNSRAWATQRHRYFRTSVMDHVGYNMVYVFY